MTLFLLVAPKGAVYVIGETTLIVKSIIDFGGGELFFTITQFPRCKQT